MTGIDGRSFRDMPVEGACTS